MAGPAQLLSGKNQRWQLVEHLAGEALLSESVVHRQRYVRLADGQQDR